MRITKFLLIVSIFTISAANLSAQLSRKPTPTREPEGAMSAKPKSTKNSLPKINSQADFDLMARVYHRGTPYAMPHVMFIIDRRSNNKIYFVNSQKFRFHKDFLLANYLIPRGSEIFKAVYQDLDRRFMVGTIAWQAPVEKFTWELWEGDMASTELIKMANTVINANFFQKTAYKPNSLRQEDASANIGLDRITQDELNKNQVYLPLNTGKGVGRLHIIDKLDDTVEIGENEILVLKELPLNLPPVRGIIVAKPSSPLSHVNILAKGWNIPNIYIKNADKLFKSLDTFWIKLDASMTDYKIEQVTKPEDIIASPDEVIPPSDLKATALMPLGKMRKADSIRYGAKSANLGEMLFRKIPGITVPDGFAVPYHWYDKFMKDNKFDEVILDLQDQNDFVHNPKFRRQKLDEFRASIMNGKFDESLRAKIIAQWKTQLGGKSVFVRSSSNSEDLPNFSGAGLYSSAFNIVEEEKLIQGVKKVWASIWNFAAYEARVRNYVSQNDVYMAALIQVGIDMEKGGVMITKDPFDPVGKGAVYISAVCGHSSPVVDNSGLPEQVLFNPRSRAVVVMTLSDQTNSMRFNELGDLKQVADTCATTTKRIMTDAQVRALAAAAQRIKVAFGNKADQDIEWGIMNGKIYIVQSRPYIDNK